MAHSLALSALLLALGGLVPQAQAGQAALVFDQAERFADAGWGAETDAVRQQLEQRLQSLAGAALPADQTLRVTVTELDLAGQPWPAHGLGPQAQFRVMRGRADWPRMHLQYQLLRGDVVLQSGRAELADMAYLNRAAGISPPPGPAGYETRMLAQWFASQFGRH